MRVALFILMIILMIAFLIWFFFGLKEKTKTVTLICDLALIVLGAAVIVVSLTVRSDWHRQVQVAGQQAAMEEELRLKEENIEQEKLEQEKEARRKAEEEREKEKAAEEEGESAGHVTGTEPDDAVSGNDSVGEAEQAAQEESADND